MNADKTYDITKNIIRHYYIYFKETFVKVDMEKSTEVLDFARRLQLNVSEVTK